MSKHPSDSFLPSGAVSSPSPRSFPPPSMISSGSQIPRTLPDYISPLTTTSTSSPKPYRARHSSHSPSQNPPISPPKTRSASAEESAAALVEDWRNYTQTLRSQSEGERAHMMADRKRMEEVMEEERALWDKERDILKARIAELEALLSDGNAGISSPRSHKQTLQQRALNYHSPNSNPGSATGSLDGSSSRAVPQESGRNADGSPFYAPAARNPSRTFGGSEITDLRVDSIAPHRENAIRVTSKELTSSDFGPQSPSSSSNHDVESKSDTTPPESIDISHIQPELEGVPIKASAVSPSFAAKVLSPRFPSPKSSPTMKDAAGRDPSNPSSSSSRSGSLREGGNGKDKTKLEAVIHAPVDTRLTMHAGHTPNHSISKFDFGESGSATPTQHNTGVNHEHIRGPPIIPFDGPSDEREGDEAVVDKELSEPLCLTNDQGKDDVFLAQLFERLKEAKRNEGASPSSESSSSRRSDSEEQADGGEGAEQEAEDVAPLRLKPSFNFGRPLGRI